MKIGDTVKRSEYALRPMRDYWLNCGREPMKSGAKDALDKAKAERGIVEFVGEGPSVVHVRMPSGSLEKSLAHRWEVA